MILGNQELWIVEKTFQDTLVNVETEKDQNKDLHARMASFQSVKKVTV